jgi:glycosyltransferase involved in cell wall biosynthesis
VVVEAARVGVPRELDENMKIAFPMLSLSLGGGEKVIFRLADFMQQRGHEVTLIAPKHRIGSGIRTNARIVEVSAPHALVKTLSKTRTTGLTPTDILAVSIPLARKLKGFDAVVANFGPTTFPVKLSGAGRARQYYLVQHDETRFFSKLSLEHWLVRMSYGGFPEGRFMTVSTWLQEMIKERTGHAASIIPPGIDHEVYRPRTRMPHAGKQVLFLARPARWRGIDIFLEAMKAVCKELPDTRLVAAGKLDRPLDTSLPIEYVFPPDEELAAMYSSADCYVLPSLLEGLPVPPLEAMACAGAVVVTDCKGTRDYAIDGENCLVVPPGDPDAMAKAVIRILTDSTLNERLRRNGPPTAAPWTYERTGQKFAEVLERG